MNPLEFKNLFQVFPWHGGGEEQWRKTLKMAPSLFARAFDNDSADQLDEVEALKVLSEQGGKWKERASLEAWEGSDYLFAERLDGFAALARRALNEEASPVGSVANDLRCFLLTKHKRSRGPLTFPILMGDDEVLTGDDKAKEQGEILQVTVTGFSPIPTERTQSTFLHPQHVFTTWNEAFVVGVEAAAKAAAQPDQQLEAQFQPMDFMVRINKRAEGLTNLEEPAPSLFGPSASLALFRGFRALLEGRRWLDPDVYFLGEITVSANERPHFHPVGSFKSKIRAVFATGRPATLVVVCPFDGKGEPNWPGAFLEALGLKKSDLIPMDCDSHQDSPDLPHFFAPDLGENVIVALPQGPINGDLR